MAKTRIQPCIPSGRHRWRTRQKEWVWVDEEDDIGHWRYERWCSKCGKWWTQVQG